MTAPFPMPAGLRFDGEMRAGSMHLLMFTDYNEASPSYQATFALPASGASAEALVAKHISKQREFSEAAR